MLDCRGSTHALCWTVEVLPLHCTETDSLLVSSLHLYLYTSTQGYFITPWWWGVAVDAGVKRSKQYSRIPALHLQISTDRTLRSYLYHSRPPPDEQVPLKYSQRERINQEMVFSGPESSISQGVSTVTSNHERSGIVQTTYGPVLGFVDEGMQKFLGIPYAAPPVGELRWRPPTSPHPWEEPLEVVSFGPICAQTSVCFPGFGSTSSTEDCLYLNVFVPIAP